jgi:phospholipid/cholesterol/gamma-HCH transport system substrate-binding protein
MNNRVNFTLIGVLVSIVSLLFFVGVYWIVKPSSEEQVTLYGLLVTESITGINVGTSVKYQGLEVGRVKSFTINPSNPREIMMTLEIRRDVPIRDGVMASIKPQGITGLSFIDIQVQSRARPLKKIYFLGRDYTVIPFKPSLLGSLSNSAEEISQTLTDILNKINKTLDVNGKNSETIVDEVADLSRQLNKLFSDKNIQNISSLIANGDETLNEYRRVAKEMRATLQTVRLSIENDEYNLKKIASDLPQETGLMLGEIRSLVRELSESIEKFEENPNALLFESTTPTAGPGEER